MPDGVARPHASSWGRRCPGPAKIALKVSRWPGPLIPANYRPITATAVACSLLHAVRQTRGRRVLPSGEMQA